MKKIVIILSVFLAISCEKDFMEINTNPDVFSETQPDYILAGAVKRTIDLMADMNKKAFWSWSHYLTVEGGSLPRYSAAPTDMNGWWERFYRDILSNLNQIDVLFAGQTGYENRVLMAHLWKVYVYSVIVSSWGPVPYFDAFSDVRTTYRYDSEEAIYTDLLNTLKTASESLDVTGDFFLNDLVFPLNEDENSLSTDQLRLRNINLWKKFANTLRLKIAVLISDVNPSLAQTHIQEVMADENMLISSNGENVSVKWGLEQQNNSPYYTDYSLTLNPVDMGVYPCLGHFIFLYLRSYSDPRLDKYASPSVLPYTVTDTIWLDTVYVNPTPNDTVAYLVQYPVPYFGRPKTARLMDVWDVTDPSPMPSSNFSYSRVNTLFLPADYVHTVISFADVCFMKAEVIQKGWGGSKTAEQYYYEGIDASFAQYGLSSKATEYMERDGIKWGTSGAGFEDFRGIVNSSIAGEPMSQIAVQRWIAGYFHGGHDAWCLQRKMRNLELPAHFNPGTPTTTSDVAADLPERLPYPLSEINLNGIEAGNAVNTYFNGINNMNGLLYFAKPYTHKDWGALTPRINHDVVKYWYGDSFEDLDAAGVDYDKIKAIKRRSVE